MRKIIALLISILVISFGGCMHNEKYEYMNDVSTIVSIKIVELTDFNDEIYEFSQSVLCDVNDIEPFISELSGINCASHFTDPIQLNTGDIVVNISYKNGDYELISAEAQMKYNSNGSHYGYKELNEEQFETLLEKYLPE